MGDVRRAYQLSLGEAPLWRQVKRCYQPARELADGHYSRQTPGAYEFMGDGETFVLYHESELGHAVWGVVHNRAPGSTEWRWRCSIFRNESGHRSSDMIRVATDLTYGHWSRRKWPTVPLTTEVDASKVRRKRDPGRCFIKAGWRILPELTTKGYIRMEAPLTFDEFKTRLRLAWCPETAHPSWAPDWTPDNPSLGQCAVTALLVQSEYGGDIIRAEMEGFGPDSWSHYWNRLPNGDECDLTWEQFLGGQVRPTESGVVSRNRMLDGRRSEEAGTRRRYELLRRLVHTTPITRDQED